MADFKLPDPRKTSGNVLGIGLLVGVGLLVYKLLLPFLLTIVWGTVSLAIGIGVAAVLLYILLSPTFWKRGRIILDSLGELCFKWFVEMNPFVILELQLTKTEEDIQDLRTQAEKLKGQEDKLSQSLEEEQHNLELAAEKIKLAKNRVTSNPNDYNAPLELESASNDWTNSKDFIDKVGPVKDNITKLVEFCDKAYTKAGYALKDAKNTLRKQRATYEAVTTGSNAMKKALRAFTGDPDMNKAGNMALEALKKDISNKVGVIRNSIQLTSQIMNERDLNDAAKVSLAVQKAEQINLDVSLQTSPELQRIPVPISAGNKYLQQLK